MDRYTGRYDDGYEALRVQNFANLKAAGIIPPASKLPPRNPAITPWEELDAEQRRRESRKMELYAAMVSNLDEHVGRLVAYLRQHDLHDDTLIVFMSDNGAAAEDFYGDPAWGDYHVYVRAHYENRYENMGKPDSFVSYGPGWAEAGSAPNVAVFPQPGLAADMASRGFLTPLAAGTADWVRENYAAGQSWVDLGTYADKSGNDQLFGELGADILNGGFGADTLDGGADNDLLTGGGGNDVFVFADRGSTDTVSDFAAGADSFDVLDISAFGFADLAAVLLAANDLGSDVHIQLDADDVLVLQGVSEAQLHEDDFIF